MGNQSASRLKGDDYQHLISWHHALEILRKPNEEIIVSVESDSSGSYDDVVVDAASQPIRFFQIKYHVDHTGQYSTEVLMKHTGNERSLLKKTYDTWNLIKEKNINRKIELTLHSNWTIDPSDKVLQCIDNTNGSVKMTFLLAAATSDIGKKRKAWLDHLGIVDGDENFKNFVDCLRFRLGSTDTSELKNIIAERMENLSLKHDEASLVLAAGIVRQWIVDGKKEITKEFLHDEIKKYNLALEKNEEKSVTIHMITIKEKKFEVEPDFFLDWRSYFEGLPNRKGHALKNPSDWNDALLPQLYEMESKIAEETGVSLVKARGLSRLSCWFAFGYVFPEVSQYIIEVDQQGQLFRTDAIASKDFSLNIVNEGNSSEGEVITGKGNTVAVGISVSGSLNNDVRSYLSANNDGVAALLLLEPNRPLGRECIRNASDVVALADLVKKNLVTFVKKWNATKLMVFYYGPLSGACFIGHRLNAVCRDIQIMEDQQPGYALSFSLK